jgi:hypothetical protein
MKYIIGLSLLILSTPLFAQQINIIASNSDYSIRVAIPLVVVDGKVMPMLVKSKADSTQLVSPMQNIDDGQIQDITILKGPSAIEAFGDAGKNGVVKIRMKQKQF